MINVRADREFDLNFKVNIKGSEEKPNVRFVFEMTQGVNVSFPGVYNKEQQTAEVSLPTLRSMGLFERENSVNAKLEVIVEGNYFVPWKDIVTIHKPIEISAEAYEPDANFLGEEVESTVENAPTIKYKKTEDNKFSPVDKLKKLKRDEKGVFTEEVINGVIHRNYKK